MAKGKLEFDLPEEREEFEDACKGSTYRYQIEEIWQRVFRPHHKHGYSDSDFQKLIDDNFEVADKIIEKLGDLYHEVVNDND